MTRKRPVQIWVNPEFKRRIKVEAAEKGMTLQQYTQHLCNKTNEDFNGKKQRKFMFDF